MCRGAQVRQYEEDNVAKARALKQLENSREAQAASLLAASKELEAARRYIYKYVYICVCIYLNLYVYMYTRHIYSKQLEHSREAQAASLLAASKELEAARRYGI